MICRSLFSLYTCIYGLNLTLRRYDFFLISDDKNQNRYDNHETEGLLEPVQTYTMTRPEPETNEPFYVYADTWHQMQMPQHVCGHFKSNKPRLKRQRVRSMPAPEVSSDEEIYYVYGP